jgi:hypothetical protein
MELFTCFFPSGVISGEEVGGQRWHPYVELRSEEEEGLDYFSSEFSRSLCDSLGLGCNFHIFRVLCVTYATAFF